VTTHKEIHDRIQCAELIPTQESIGTILDILESINDKLAAVERDNHEMKMQLDELNQTHE
jgi:DNA integrity scanning protein DisA with diadenylate cyclase activity